MRVLIRTVIERARQSSPYDSILLGVSRFYSYNSDAQNIHCGFDLHLFRLYRTKCVNISRLLFLFEFQFVVSKCHIVILRTALLQQYRTEH